MSEFACEGASLDDRTAVVTIRGELDLATSSQLKDCLTGLGAGGSADHLVIDLSDCTFVDSTGLGLLVGVQHQAAAPLHIVATQRQVRQVLAMTALDSVFSVHATREDAVASLQGWSQSS